MSTVAAPSSAPAGSPPPTEGVGAGLASAPAGLPCERVDAALASSHLEGGAAEPTDGPPDAVEPVVRRILHVDMDAFFASVEQRDHPELRGRPVAVGGSPGGRGVVAAASYEARAFGVRSAMSAGKAARLCPTLQFVRPRFEVYKAVSQAVFTIFRSITPHVEGLSLDEAFLDVTDHLAEHGTARAVAEHIRTRIREEVGLTASAGVAPLKFVAKIASGYRKPDGLTVVAPSRVREFLHPLPVGKIWGVGPKSSVRLHAHGLHTIGDIARQDPLAMLEAFGGWGEQIWRMSQGIDPRRVRAHRSRRSRSAERTFADDISDLPTLESHVERLAERVGSGLRKAGEEGDTVVLKVRYADFTTITRSRMLRAPTHAPDVLAQVARRLLRERSAAGRRPVRLLGVGVRVRSAPPPTRQLRLPFP